MLFPVLPSAMADQLDVTITETGTLFVFLLGGRVVAGPFVNYLIDVFKRKYLCITSLIILLIATAVYGAVDNKAQAFSVAFIQGIAFGVISSSFITISIDLTSSEFRNRINVLLGWTTRLGMLLGIALGSFLYLNTNFATVIYGSLTGGIIALACLSLVKIPFRAPIGSDLLSFDRFLLPRGWVPALSVMMASFIPGIFIPLVHYRIESSLVVNGWLVPYFVFAFVGYAISWYFNKQIKKCQDKITVITGLIFMLLAVSVFLIFDLKSGFILSGILLGIGLGLITPLLLMQFIELANHCERASANTTNLLSWGIGLSAGLCVSCYLTDNYTTQFVWQSALFLASFSLLYFIFFTYPYYVRKKKR